MNRAMHVCMNEYKMNKTPLFMHNMQSLFIVRTLCNLLEGGAPLPLFSLHTPSRYSHSERAIKIGTGLFARAHWLHTRYRSAHYA